MELLVVNGISEVGAERWNRLAGQAFYLSYSWLQVVETDPTIDCKYVIAVEAENVVAALPVYRDLQPDASRHYQPELLFEAWPRHASYLFVGTRRAYRNGLLMDHDALNVDFPRVLRQLLRRAKNVFGPAVDTLIFAHLAATEARRLVEAGFLTRPVPTGHDAWLHLEAQNLSEHLEQLSAKRRKRFVREMEIFHRSGLAFSVEKLESCHAEAATLTAELLRKYGAKNPLPSMKAFLRTQADILDRYAVTFVARRNGDMVGYVLGYEWSGKLYQRMAGFDYARTAGTLAYFALAMYEPIRYSYGRRLSSINLGIGATEAKLLRGARLEVLSSGFLSGPI